MEADPTPFTVLSGKGHAWQSAGIWLENGQTFIAKTAGQRGENSVSGFIANGGNPKIDGTWPDHENFALNQPFTIKHGSGYVYFRMRPRHVMHNWKAWATRSNWSLTVTLEQM